MFELIFILFLVFVALIVLGLFFKGKVWSPTVTVFGEQIKVSIAVPQVAFSIVQVAPPSLATVAAIIAKVDAPPAPPTAK